MRAFAGLLACVLLPGCGGVAERQTEQASLPASESTAPAQNNDTPAATATAVDEPAPADVPEFQGNGNVNSGASQAPVECTLAGCLGGLGVKFEKSTPWQSGSYRVRLWEDGQETADCNAIVPEPSAGREIRHDCPADTLDFIGDAGSTPAIWGVHVATTAELVEIEIADGEQRLARAEYSPVWREYRPNGPRCGPVCITATEETLVLE
jgi:hypothetical protein